MVRVITIINHIIIVMLLVIVCYCYYYHHYYYIYYYDNNYCYYCHCHFYQFFFVFAFCFWDLMMIVISIETMQMKLTRILWLLWSCQSNPWYFGLWPAWRLVSYTSLYSRYSLANKPSPIAVDFPGPPWLYLAES